MLYIKMQDESESSTERDSLWLTMQSHNAKCVPLSSQNEPFVCTQLRRVENRPKVVRLICSSVLQLCEHQNTQCPMQPEKPVKIALDEGRTKM